MFQTILNPYDVFRNDISIADISDIEEEDRIVLDTDPSDFLSRDGFYL